MANIKISIVNDSTVLSDSEVAEKIPAFQKQIDEHFAPIWGLNAQLYFLPKYHDPLPGSWWLTILDSSDQNRAGAYHEKTPQGLPLGKVFAKSDAEHGLSWTVSVSHELLEMLVDPEINLTVFIQEGENTGRLYPYEICDPVEDDTLAYEIDGVKVSNFVFPAYFEPDVLHHNRDVKLDYQGVLKEPVPALVPGSHIAEFQVGGHQGWVQKQVKRDGASTRGELRAASPHGRSGRRANRRNWQNSAERLFPMRLFPMRAISDE